MVGADTLQVFGHGDVLVLPRDVELQEVAGKPVVDGRVKAISEDWGLRLGALVPDDVLAWIDHHMGLDDTKDTFGYDPSRGPWKEQVHRGSLWRSVIDDDLELYVFERYRQVGMEPEFWLFLRGEGRISPKPCRIACKWLKRRDARTPPRVQVVELDGQGTPEFVVHGFGHNGTVYNAEQEFYLEQMPDLALRQVLLVDAKLYWPFEGDAGDVFRRLAREAPNRLTMQVDQINHQTGAHVALGRAVLTRTAIGEKFEVSSSQVLADKGDRFLVSSDEH